MDKGIADRRERRGRRGHILLPPLNTPPPTRAGMMVDR